METTQRYLDIDSKLIDSYIVKFPSSTNPEDFSIKPQNSNLTNFSIIDDCDPDWPLIQSLLKSQSFNSLKESKALALFIGSAIGDSLGAHLECYDYNPNGYNIKGFPDVEAIKKIDVGQWTDDTAEALCVADSLLINDLKFDPIDIKTRFVHWWFSGYNNGKKNQEDDFKCKLSYGIGGFTLNKLIKFISNREPFVDKIDFINQKSSNGSIMRIAPIPIAFHYDINAGVKFAGEQSYCTHDGIEASECCKLLTWLAIKGLNHPKKGFEVGREILDQLGNEFQSDVVSVRCLSRSEKELDYSVYQNSQINKSIEDRNWDWKNSKFDYSSYRIEIRKNLMGIYSMDCVAMALHILYHNEGFFNCVLKAVNLGGDADSLGGIVGMLAGSFYGFNEDIQENYKYIQKWDENSIALKAYKLLNLRK